MDEVVSTVARGRQSKLAFVASRMRVEAPGWSDWAAALSALVLLVLSFPDFGVWPLAWTSLLPLLVVIGKRPAPARAFLLGWLVGTAFFYLSCYWLTYSMIHFGHLPQLVAYLLLVPGALTLGLFPGIFAFVMAAAVRRWRPKALFVAPFIWAALEWARLEITGQLWNAIGYSQAYQPTLIQVSRWGGVYAVGFLILTVNAAVAFALLNRCKRGLAISLSVILLVVLVGFAASRLHSDGLDSNSAPALIAVALQPNVPMDPSASSSQMEELTAMHLSESAKALDQLPAEIPRLVIWPESPMNFAYGSDAQFQIRIAEFTKRSHASLIFNSQERAPGNGIFNSAILVNEEGRAIAQYDKIRLLPFGEYVPLPRWVPGASLISGIVGDFTPGEKYTLMPLGSVQAGVFICIESAYPSIAGAFANEGAEVLINISNDGYLGPTAVMRQHLANAIFRAVENARPVLRVTNSGITAYIDPSGKVVDPTGGFQRAMRVWSVYHEQQAKTFYTTYPNVFVLSCSIVAFLTLFGSFIKRRAVTENPKKIS
jgi:apolipoprotein N-acyltransferase